jgi:transposase
MTLDLASSFTSARRAGRFFAGLCGSVGCPRCGKQEVYALSSGRLRCSHCRYTFHRYSRRFINRGHLPPEYWHAVLRYFIEGLPPLDAADRLRLTPTTVFKAYATVRLAITALSEDGRLLLGDGGDVLRFCPTQERMGEGSESLCLSCRSPVMGVGEVAGKVRLRLIPGLTAQLVFTMPLQLKRWRTLVMTQPMQEWEGLLFCCCKTARTLFQSKFTTSDLRLEASDFFAFSEGWFSQYHCLAPETSLTYLKEMELRYNHRSEPLYPLLARALCALVSKSAD